ncbi:hypothetical protein F383_14226 [Gossypium arboreum]|uniref:Uncharacterized protein n=1 Tax=Gossypium arboreum TaxID=29729 RepID=A0A0B0PWV9_GOSAR|nr:hypothetical protein F383_14226 [Gossypium arboreum]
MGCCLEGKLFDRAWLRADTRNLNHFKYQLEASNMN